MRKSLLYLAMASAILTVNGVGAQSDGKKILVAWYSWGGNTQTVGKFIREMIRADVFVIEPVEPYSTDYRTCTREARAEIDAGLRRPIKGGEPDIGDYDIIIVGTPNWWSAVAPPVLSFLAGHDLTGKTVAPLVTHGGGREARCFRNMEKAAPQANFLKGFVVAGNRAGACETDVEQWLREIGIL